MLDHFRNTHPYAIVLIVITAVILWIPVFINPDIFLVSGSFESFPLSGVFSFLLKLSNTFLVITGFIFYLILAFFLVFINSKHQVTERRDYLPALFFILSSAWIIGIQQVSPPLIGALFVFFSFDRFFASYNRTKVISSLFDAGLLIGIGSLFYIPYATLFIIIWLGIFLFRFEDWRAWLVSLFGFLTPWVFAYGLYFYFTSSVVELNGMISSSFLYRELVLFPLPSRIVVLFVVLVLTLFTSYYLVIKMKSIDIRSKRFFYLLNWALITLFIVYLFQPALEKQIIIGLAFPLSFLFTDYFSQARKNWYVELVFSGYLIGMIISMYIPLFITD